MLHLLPKADKNTKPILRALLRSQAPKPACEAMQHATPVEGPLCDRPHHESAGLLFIGLWRWLPFLLPRPPESSLAQLRSAAPRSARAGPRAEAGRTWLPFATGKEVQHHEWLNFCLFGHFFRERCSEASCRPRSAPFNPPPL
eukprot:COSAG04_NODE_8662_length_944_cov_2.422485_1_plen_142_part_01